MRSPEFRLRFRATREASPDLGHHEAIRITEALEAERLAVLAVVIQARFEAFKKSRGIP